MAISKINIPHKVPTSTHSADEFNLVTDTINEIIDEVERPSHAFSSDHFIIEGSVNVGGVAYPQIKLKLNPAHFEIVNGLISIKASLLA